MKTYQLKLTYRKMLSVHHITTLVESVKGGRLLQTIRRGGVVSYCRCEGS